jgi:hypothetical protein
MYKPTGVRVNFYFDAEAEEMLNKFKKPAGTLVPA